MTLGQVLARATNVPKVGDHEVVVGPDGLGHILWISSVENAEIGPTLSATLGFIVACGGLLGVTDPSRLEVAPSVTCMACAVR